MLIPIALVTLGVSGCAAEPQRADSVRPASVEQSSSVVLADQLLTLEPETGVEPSGDSTGGTFLCRVTSVSADSSPTVVIDIVTPQFPPGTTKRDRERSSWPGRFGWNRIRHRQTLAIGGATLAVTDTSHELRITSVPDFAAGWKRGGSKWNYYVTFHGDVVDRLWAWTY